MTLNIEHIPSRISYSESKDQHDLARKEQEPLAIATSLFKEIIEAKLRIDIALKQESSLSSLDDISPLVGQLAKAENLTKLLIEQLEKPSPTNVHHSLFDVRRELPKKTISKGSKRKENFEPISSAKKLDSKPKRPGYQLPLKLVSG